jgi:nudix-type nucleoside diphosphatase (YffH/AdpP family)
MQILAIDTVYKGFLQLDKVTIQIPAIDKPFTREVLLRAPAACVLLYDKVLDVVLVVEEFRIGNLAAGLPEDQCWSLGPVAGMIEPGSTPAETARREAAEEAGFDADGILMYGPFSTLPSPGGLGEIIHHFVAFCDLSNVVNGTRFGLADEHESTVVHLLPRVEAMDMLTSGAPLNGLLVTCLLHLERILRG